MRRFVDASLTLRALEARFADDQSRQGAFREARKGLEEELGLAIRNYFLVRDLAKNTESADLFFEILTLSLSAIEDLPEMLGRFEEKFAEPADFDSGTSDTIWFQLAEHTISLVEFLEGLCTKHPERFRLLARELPYWPMLVFRHKAANNHLFEKSGDGQRPLAEALELGKDCPINVSNRANYSLKTPINAFVWDLLREFQWGRAWARDIRAGKIRRSSPAQSDLELFMERGHVSREEAEIYFGAAGLPALDKETARQWLDEAVMPLVRLKHPDLREVYVFSKLNTGPRGRSYAPARKQILKALQNLTREAGAGWA